MVYAGSLARAVEVPSIGEYGTRLRTALREKGLFVDVGDQLRLTEDYVFTSPSTAAMAMLGHAANGRIEWKTGDGRTLEVLQTVDAGGEA